MKKLIIVMLLSSCLTASAFAQGNNTSDGASHHQVSQCNDKSGITPGCY